MTPEASKSETPHSSSSLRPFEASLPMGLLRAREASMQFFRPLLTHHGLTEQQWRVLRVLASADTSLATGELARRTFLLGPSLTRILGNLEDRALIARLADSNDNRRSQVELTTAGRVLYEQIAPASEDQYVQIEASFGRDRLRGLLEELAELEHLLNEELVSVDGQNPLESSDRHDKEGEE